MDDRSSAQSTAGAHVANNLPIDDIKARAETGTRRYPHLQSTLKTLDVLTSDNRAATAALQYLAKNPERVDVSVVAGMIETDAALTARFLRLANAAVFGARATVSNVKAALVALGAEATKQVLVSSAFLVPRRDRYVVRRTEVWAKSLRGACWAKALAEKERAGDAGFASSAFAAALLRDIGQLVIMDWFPEALQRIDVRVPAGERESDAEAAELDLSHEDIGAYLARAWAFPKATVEAIWFHHLTAEMQACVVVDSMTRIVRSATLLGDHEFSVLANDAMRESLSDWTREGPERARTLLEQVANDLAQAASLVATA